MTRNPTDPGDRRTPAEVLYAEHLARLASGEQGDLEDLCARHPEHDTALRVLALADGGAPEAAASRVEAMIRERLGRDLPPERLPGGRAERYTIRREVARGGMGVVYEAWDEDLGRALAMKVIQGPAGLERFLQEARITGRLDHPGVLPVHELGIDAGGRAFFTMPLVHGSDLEKVLRKAAAGEEGWSSTRVLEVLVRVCDTLAYAHSRGVIHRDLKPENVMVGRFGETYVMDWGLARVLGEDAAPACHADAAAGGGAAGSPHRTSSGTVLGTPAYMPPEQAAGDLEALDERSDIYAVGGMLYTLLTGRRPYASPGSGRSSREIVESVLAGPPARIQRLNRGAPPELVAISERAMARAKSDRYSTMEEMAGDLRAFLEGRVVRAHRTGALAELRKWVARNRSVAAAATLALLALAGLLSWREVTRRELEEERNEKTGALVRTRDALLEKEAALRRSEANRLTALSVAQLPNDPTLALLLALEGASRAPGPVASNALIAALGSLRETLTLWHNIRVSDVAFDASGSRLLTASQDGTARIFDLATGEERLRLAAGEPLYWALFDRSEGRILGAGRPGAKLHVWDSRSGALLEVRTFPAAIGDLRATARGERIIVATDDGRVEILDAGTLAAVNRLQVGARGASDRSVLSVDLHPDGERLIVAGKDHIATEWSLASRKPAGLTLSDCAVVRYSPDGRSIVAGSSDGGARVLDAATGEPRAEFAGHRDQIQDAVFPPGGRSVLTASLDGTARLWDLETGKALAVLGGHLSDVLGVASSADGRLFATASHDARARVWGAGPPMRAGATPDALAAGSAPVTRDGRRVLRPRGREVDVWEPETGRRIRTLGGHSGIVLVAAFSPDGRLVVTGTADAEDGARVWDLEGGRLVATLRGHPSGVLSASFDPRGERVVATHREDSSARIFDATTGEVLAVLRGHTARVFGTAFSEDGKRVVTGSHDGTVRAWDAATGRPEWEARATDRVQFVGFFDGDTVIAGTYRNLVHVVDAASGRVRRAFGGRGGTLLRAACHPARGIVATSSSDATTRIWRVSTGEEILAIPTPESGFRHVAFSADGARLYTLAGECDLQAWPLDPLAAARGLKPRDLTPQEQHRFEIGTSEERARYKTAWNSDWVRRNLAAVDRALARRPGDWRLRDHSIELLKTCHGILSSAGGQGELEALERRLVVAAMDPRADGKHLLDLAAIQGAAAGGLDALETLERAVRRPHAGPEVESALAALRAALLPDLATFDSIDAALDAAGETLVGPGAAWRFFRGRSEPSPGLEWTLPELDDSAWEEGAAGFAYGDGGALADGDRGTVLDDMMGSYTTVYARRRVVLADPGKYGALVLSVRADDGFVAHAGGVEIGRERAGPAGVRLSFDAVADGAAPEPPPAHEIRIPVPRPGVLVIAIQGLNRSKDSSDFSLLPVLRGEVRPGVVAAEKGEDLLAAVRWSTRPGAAARAAYLEGRLRELEGKLDEALGHYEAAAAADSGEAGPEGSARPEPLLRLAGCLEAMGRAADAEERLRSALSRGAGGNERVWDRWIGLCFGPLGLDAPAVLARFPATAAGNDRSGRGAMIRALLESLRADGAVRINCGGGEHVSADGSRWLADAFHTGGYRYFGDRFGGATAPFAGEVQGTEDDDLYRTERWFPRDEGSPYGYAIPLPAGRWRVVFHFAEILQGRFERKFDVLVEDRVAARDFEPGAAGFAMASSLSHDAGVFDGRLDVDLPARADRMQPKISAIEVHRLGGSTR